LWYNVFCTIGGRPVVLKAWRLALRETMMRTEIMALATLAFTLLLCGSENWGQSSQQDNAGAKLPDPPPYAGWRRAIAAGGDCEILAVSDGMVLVGNDTTLYACALATGALSFRYDEPKYDRMTEAMILQGRVFIQCYDGLIVLDLTSGNPLWDTGEVYLLAVGDGGAWVRRIDPQAYGNPHEHIVLLDSATGQERHVFSASDQHLMLLASEPVESDYLAVKRNGAVQILLPNGTESRLPSLRPDWAAVFVYGPDWLLVGECPDYELWRDGSKQQFLQQLQTALIDPATGQPGASLILSRYTMPSGELKWRRETTTPPAELFYPDGLKCIGDAVYQTGCIPERPAISFKDGSDVLRPVPAVKEAGPGNWMHDGGYWYYCRPEVYVMSNYCDIEVGYSDKDEWTPCPVMRIADPVTGKTQPVIQESIPPMWDYAVVSNGYLVDLMVNVGEHGSALPAILYGTALGPDGLPQAGQMVSLP
jgi:hypothetical protein